MLTEPKAALNKQKFSQLVKDYNSISSEDRNKLHELVSTYPYSQAIHTLIAKANKDANTAIANQTLGYAAMYAADRGVLKEIIESKPQAPDEPTAILPNTETQSNLSEKSTDTQTEQTPYVKRKSEQITVDASLLNKESLSETIMADLHALKVSKANYLEWLSMPEEKVIEEEEKESKPKTAAKQKAQPKKTTSKTVKKEAPKSKATKAKTSKTDTKKATSAAKEKKSITTKTKTTKNTKAAASKKRTTTKKNEASSQNQEENKENVGAVDQSHIIDNFISKEPSITAKPSKKAPTNQEDLSEPSTTFNEDLISENLAKILTTQGKTDKAIEIYKKLIWKFPQKKSYFASQIEELKK